jgi:chitodextrinase
MALLLLGVGLVVPSPATAVQFPQTRVVSDDPANWTPWVDNGYVQSIAQVGNTIIVGGNFSSVRAPGAASGIPRTHLFAFDATTGAIDPNFRPVLNGFVHAVVPSPDGLGVIAGGQFSSVNGANRRGPAKFFLSNGALDPSFTATTAGGPIDDMVVRGNSLYVGGRFTTANNVARPYLAAFDATTGALDNRLNMAFAGTINGGSTQVDALDVTPDGSRMVVIGNFTTVAGQSRPQVTQFDLTTNPFTVANWQTTRYAGACASGFTYWVRDVDYSPDGSYFAIVTTGAFRGGFNAGVLCDTTARWETFRVGSGLQPTWAEYTGGDTLVGVAVTGTAVYVTGHHRWENNPFVGDAAGPGAVSRQGLAALDPINGVPFSWNPRRNISGGSSRGTFLATSQGLWHGTDTLTVANEQHPRLSFFPLAGGTTVPPSNTGTLPGTLISLPATGTPQTDLIRRTFDGTTAGAPTVQNTNVNWSNTRGVFMINGTLYAGSQDGTLSARTFNGTTLGPATVLNPYVVSPGPVFANVTGVFFSGGSIYYTIAGDPTMHSRYFTPQSGVIGAVRFNVPSNGFNWSQARSLTMANGRLYWATPDGRLHTAIFTGTAPQAGTDAVVNGAGQGWGGNFGMFVLSSSSSADTEDPTAPGNLRSTSVMSSRVDLAWDAATDNVGITGYDIHRNGSPIDSVSGDETTYADTTVEAGTFYSYRVFATDAAGNVSPASNQLTLTTPPPSSDSFTDDFESGNMSSWTQVVNTAVQSADVFAGSNAAMATAAGSRAFASRTFGQTFTSLNYETRFKVISQGANAVNLLTVQTQTGTGLAALFRSAGGNLALRNVVTGGSMTSGVSVPLGVWHHVQVAIEINGTSSTIQVLFNGSQLNALTGTFDLGTTPVGRLVIGDSNSGRTFQVAFDEVSAF